jgi:hypothetical protein
LPLLLVLLKFHRYHHHQLLLCMNFRKQGSKKIQQKHLHQKILLLQNSDTHQRHRQNIYTRHHRHQQLQDIEPSSCKPLALMDSSQYRHKPHNQIQLCCTESSLLQAYQDALLSFPQADQNTPCYC